MDSPTPSSATRDTATPRSTGTGGSAGWSGWGCTAPRWSCPCPTGRCCGWSALHRASSPTYGESCRGGRTRALRCPCSATPKPNPNPNPNPNPALILTLTRCAALPLLSQPPPEAPPEDVARFEAALAAAAAAAAAALASGEPPPSPPVRPRPPATLGPPAAGSKGLEANVRFTRETVSLLEAAFSKLNGNTPTGEALAEVRHTVPLRHTLAPLNRPACDVTPRAPVPRVPRVPTLLPATRTRLQMRGAMGLEERQLQGWFSNRRLKDKAKEMGVPSWQMRAREMRAAYTKQKVPARTPDELCPQQHMLRTLSTCSRASAMLAHRSRLPRPWRLIRGSRTCDACCHASSHAEFAPAAGTAGWCPFGPRCRQC